MEKPLTAGQQKVDEYVDRIKNGESKESIFDGLPTSFMDAIELGLNIKSSEEIEAEQKSIEDQLNEVRKQLGISENDSESVNEYNEVAKLVEKVSAGRSKPVMDLYQNLFADIDNPESKKALIKGLFQDVYNGYRRAEYPDNPDEEKIWEASLSSTNIPINTKKTEWIYRGNFPQNGEETGTRGSLNVEVTPELIHMLDEMILNGEIRANYKFGQPGTPASPYERHDAISMYFLEEPSEEALKKIEEITKPYVRGDNLLGKKISEGFYMSEIGSIQSNHIDKFVEELKDQDSELAKSVREYASPILGQGTSLKMSEAQYYAIKDTLKAFGKEISYDNEVGFEITG